MIYLDSAATSFQKPPEVPRAVLRAMRTMSSPGRGGYAAARAADELLFSARTSAAALFGATGAEQVVFTSSATHGLNVAIKSLLRPGGRTIVSGYEHNAVTRVLHALDAEVIVASSPLFDPEACTAAFARALEEGADAVICTHASNVFGFILPIGRIAALCRNAGVPLIVDASQTAGVLPVDLAAWGASFVAMPGHKGLYGPQGTGLLLCAADARPLLEGGTGSESLVQEMPAFLPDRLEPGTHNVPGIAGLAAGMRFVTRTGREKILQHERALIRRAAAELSATEGVTVYAADDPDAQLGVLSFTVEGQESEETALALARAGVAVRAGYHCAPFAHRTAGTLERGTVRLSVSAFTGAEEIDRFARILRKCLREKAR